MKLSYAVTTHNEHKEISKLIPFILENKDPEDELVIIDNFGLKKLKISKKFI